MDEGYHRLGTEGAWAEDSRSSQIQTQPKALICHQHP